MDSSASGFLRAIPGLSSRESPSPELSPKDKRLWLAVEKALASFDHLDEWADYIAFLSRLQKALLLTDEPNRSVGWIPLAHQVLAKLALCLSFKLPNGVHQKTISIYDLIFSKITGDLFNRDIQVWLPGLLPVVSYGSMQVKPQLLALYKNHLLVQLHPDTLKKITRPVLLSLLAGLDDENLEVFADIMAILDQFKEKLNDSAHFWQSLFLCIITSPEKRMGALNWCAARLPVLSAMKVGNESKFSVEAQACLTPDPGLLVRAFATALDTSTTFNQATDVIVVRGFFDLLLTHLPVSSEVINSVISPTDKELLLMACCKVTLKRDMSLNRRLWAWLLGPEAHDEQVGDTRINYFKLNAVQVVETGLLKLINGNSPLEQMKALRMSLSLILDRWEINKLLTPRIFVPILKASFLAFKKGTKENLDVVTGAKAFFDEVEACYIWNYITCDLIADSSLEGSEMLEYLLRNFHFPEEERAIHIPLAIICLLSSYSLTANAVATLELLIELCLPNLLAPLETEIDFPAYKRAENVSTVKSYYEKLIIDDNTEPPFSSSEVSLLIMNYLKDWYVESLQKNICSKELLGLLSDFLYSVPNKNNVEIFPDRKLIDTVLAFPPYTWGESEVDSTDMSSVFGIVNLCRYLVKSASAAEKSKILRIVLSNLWLPLVTLYPANHQVEAVRYLFDLEICFDVHQIEAGILDMLLHTPSEIRVKSFYKLWVHSADFSDAEAILSNPLHVILDDLFASSKGNAMSVEKFVHNAITDGSAARLLKLITNPLLSASFMRAQKTEINSHDDLTLFAYNLDTVLNVIRSNEKLLKESFNHEFVVSESTEKFELIKSNQWDISNYKSLVICIIQKFFNLKLSLDLLHDRDSLKSYLDCITSALDLHSMLITGTESDFESHFRLLIDRCLYLIRDLDHIPYEIELAEAQYIKCILHTLQTAKSMSINLKLLQHEEGSKDPLLVNFIVQGIAKCQSSTLLEKWFALLTSSVYLFNESVFNVILTLNDAIIDKVQGYMKSVKSFDKVSGNTGLEASLSILLSGLEDLLSISHSYLVTSNLRASAKVQNVNGESGFLGNVILGVFQIESPDVRTEEQNKILSILISFQDASRLAFDIWNWADNRPQAPSDFKMASSKSITYLANKLKFRSRKLLESLSELERQEVIETIIEAPCETSTKVKILHVLDSGRSQVTLPHILNSITTRCHPQSLSEKELSSKNSLVTERQLSEFLEPYYESIDYDTVDDIWECSVSFFREVLSHPTFYKSLLIYYLEAIKTLSLKSTTKKVGETRRNSKELASLFLSMLNAVTSSRNNDGEGASDRNSQAQLNDLTRLVEHFDDILKDSDKTNTAITTIITSVILPSVKVKNKLTDEPLLNLTSTIGSHHPNRAWKQLVLDVFMDNSFFTSGKFGQDGWKKSVALWIDSDKEKLNDLVARVTPSAQASAANIFIWNEHSEVEDRIFILKRISYLILVQPQDLFVSVLDELFTRLSAALNSSCPPLYKSEAFNLFRVISLRFSEMLLLPYWLFISQNLLEVFTDTVVKITKDPHSLTKEQLKLVLSACKLLDQLLLIGFDEFTLDEWLYVATSSVTDVSAKSTSLMDQLAVLTEVILTKEDPIAISNPASHTKVAPLLFGVRTISNVASLKRFFGLLSYACYERSYGLCEADVSACNHDALGDLYVR